jgi:hypothetical protein
MKNSMKPHLFLIVLVTVLWTAGCKKSAFQDKAKPELVIRGDDPRLQSSTIHFFKDTVYVLAVSLERNDGESLVIDAGTLIKINNGLTITINPGALIEADGTANDPIVFTSSAATGGAGIGTGTTGSERYWQGLRIYGNFLTNPTMGSGKLRYVRIEFAGFENIQGAGLLLQDVTKETVLENIEVSYAHKTSAFEFSGGNCNAKNLVSYASNLHDFYIHNGYQGMLQNLLAWRHPFFPTQRLGPNLAGLFVEGTNTFPLISNLTVIGPDMQKGTRFTYLDINSSRVASIVTTDGAKFRIRNSAVFGFPKGGYFLDDGATALSLVNEESELAYSIFHSNDTTRVFYLSPSAYPPATSSDLKQYLLSPQFVNLIFDNSSEFMLEDPFNYDVNPNPMPRAGSPLLDGAEFSDAFDNPFFEKVSYRGAAGTQNWLQGWTNFLPLQTNYNN